MKKLVLSAVVFSSIWLTGCNRREADIASHNVSTAARDFAIDRRVIFYNGITDKYILVIEGKCNIHVDSTDKQLEVTCKVNPNEYKKHYLGLSDNVTYFVEQLYPKGVNAYHYSVAFNPQSIIPDIDFKGDIKSLKDAFTPDNND